MKIDHLALYFCISWTVERETIDRDSRVIDRSSSTVIITVPLALGATAVVCPPESDLHRKYSFAGGCGPVSVKTSGIPEEVRCQIMTDTSSLPTTHSPVNQDPVTARKRSPESNGPVAPPAVEDDDEPYTIKCICEYEDDDGNTVYCERCDTWQHIVCYYEERDVPEIHNCTDCDPRHLDSTVARERQKRLRDQHDGSDRKTKRSGSRSHKKKTKELSASGDLANGWSSSTYEKHTLKDSSATGKKPKSAHRSSLSATSLSLVPPLSLDSRKRAPSQTGSAISPIKTSQLRIPLYSHDFLHLYDDDHPVENPQSNLLNISITAALVSWAHDPSTIPQSANGRPAKDVFTYLEGDLDQSRWPTVSPQMRTDTSVDFDGIHPTWKFLTVEDDVRRDHIVGEVRGKVGFFREYCLDPNSRWKELRHPEPFVFFHPQLPIFIDSRTEGTELRYVRRSCRPNVTMRTFIVNESEYHFCFVANQDIPAHSEITATWYLDPQLCGPNDLVSPEGSDDGGISDSAAICLSNVLAHFGGCACESSTCLLAKIDRRRPLRSSDSGKQMNGSRGRNKSKSNASPHGSGRVNNSSAGSESAKLQDDEDPTDQSASGSTTRDHPRSRDLTPLALSPKDNFSYGGELSAREKRKIAAMERKFEQLEQDQQHRKKTKRERAGGVSGQESQHRSLSPHKRPSAPKPSRLDTPNNRRSSGSPAKPSPRSARSNSRKVSASMSFSPLRQYVNASVQTEPDEVDCAPVVTPQPRYAPYVPPMQRMLLKCQRDRQQLSEARGHLISDGSKHDAMPPPSFGLNTRFPKTENGDVEMRDAEVTVTPFKPGSSDRSRTSPLPSTAAHQISVLAKKPAKDRDMHVQLPPPFPASPNTESVLGLAATSPFSFTNLPPLPASYPSGTSVAAPSPVKKKLTLGDYLSRRGSLATTPTTEKIPQQSLSQSKQSLPSLPTPRSPDNGETSQSFPAEATREYADTEVVMKDAPAELSGDQPLSAN